MYNDKILSQLNHLNYLHVIKNSNITVMSKKNQFGDMVKFYAQINSNDIIQKISYKATGCTYFLVFCNHFCELVVGKKIDKALKINIENLENFVELDESRKHVAHIILDTFALLIKKYRNGVERGKILPIEVVEDEPKDTSKKEEPKKPKIKDHKDSEKITNINNKGIKQADNILALKSMVKSSKSKNAKDTSDKSANNDEVKKLNNMITKISHDNNQKNVDKNSDKLKSLNKSLDNINKTNKKENIKIETKDQKYTKTSNKKESKQDKVDLEKDNKRKELEEKKKKGLFNWLKRK